MRIEAGLTQKRLAQLAGISQAHVAKIEQGKVDPRLSTVNRILHVLKTRQEGPSKDIMTKGVIFARPDESVLEASDTMVKNAISQLPVLEGNRVVGTITEEGIIRNLRSDLAGEKVSRIMDPPLPSISEETPVEVARSILERRPGVLVMKGREAVGIITRSDLLKTIG